MDQLFITGSATPNVVVAGVDDDTIKEFGRWSQWSRDLHARAVDNLNKAGARVIGYDVLFVDSSPGDEEFAASISGKRVVLSCAGIEPQLQLKSVEVFGDFLMPVPSLEESAKAVGHVNLVPDPDGKVRQLPLIVEDKGGGFYPAFSLVVLHSLFSMPLPEKYVINDGKLDLLARHIPVDPYYNLRINYSADPNTFSYLSYGAVINGSFDPATVKNKIVLVGMTATGELDTWKTPTSAGNVPGVYIHAIVLDTILRQRYLVDVAPWISALGGLLLAGIMVLTVPRLKLRWTTLIAAGLFLAGLVASFFAFDNGYIVPFLYVLLPVPFLYVSSILCLIAFEQNDKRFIQDIFGRYVSPQVSRQLLALADNDRLSLGGELREVTVLFADMRNFTRLSEQVPPQQLVDILNTYFAVIIDEVMKHGGMVNKFAGDNIMAVWNTPQTQPEHALLAVKAAWHSQLRLARLRQNGGSLPPVQFGIGISTGNVLAGNIGTMGRSEYTVIGDTVNLASRICGAAPGGDIWVSAETYFYISAGISVEELEAREFKGKSGPVTVYRVKGLKQDQP